MTTTVTDIDSRQRLRRRPGRLPRQGQAVVLRRVQPRPTRIDDTTIIRTIDVAWQPGCRQRSSRSTSTAICSRQAHLAHRRGPHAQRHRLRRPRPERARSSRSPVPQSTWKGVRKTGGTDLVGQYGGVFGSRLLVSGMYARHKEKRQLRAAPARRRPAVDRFDGHARTQTQAASDSSRTRTSSAMSYKGDVTKYLGTHDFKLGGDCEHVNGGQQHYNGGAGQRIYKLRISSAGDHLLPPPLLRRRQASGFSRTDPTTWQIAVPLTSEPRLENMSFYAQDSWKADAGLHDQRRHPLGAAERPRPRSARRAFKLNDNWAPRIGFVWDVAQEQPQQALRELGPLLREHPAGHQHPRVRRRGAVLLLQLQPEPGRHSCRIRSAASRSRSSAAHEPVDPDLKGQYIDECLGGLRVRGGAEPRRRRASTRTAISAA